MKKGLGKNFYKVELYQVLGPNFSPFSKSICDAWEVGEIIVSASKNGGTNSTKRIGKCREVLEDFEVCVVYCPVGYEFDAEIAERIPQLYLPYDYDYNNKYKNFIVIASDLNERNLATEEDIKTYEPKRKAWYDVLKEIQENKKETKKKIYKR